MSKASEAVKRWRANTKRRIIESMGGKCAQCGYDRCDAALELHHLDPNQKEMSFGSVKANPMAWAKIVEELRKCVLLCAICHREVHAGVLVLADQLPSFNEEYRIYEELNPSRYEKKNKCPYCDNEKPVSHKTCSPSCGVNLKGTIDWSKYDIFELLTKFSYREIADHIGCSTAAVGKQVKKLRAQ